MVSFAQLALRLPRSEYIRRHRITKKSRSVQPLDAERETKIAHGSSSNDSRAAARSYQLATTEPASICTL
jgi:hypothetical protein